MKPRFIVTLTVFVLLPILFLLCVDDLNTATTNITKENAALSIIPPQKKQDEPGFKIGKLLRFKVTMTYPKFFDTLIVDFGEPSNVDNIQIDSSIPITNVESNKEFSIIYQNPGIKKISVTAKYRNADGQRIAYDSLRIGIEPKIVNRDIKIWPTKPMLSMPCSISVEVINTNGDTPVFQWVKDGDVLPSQIKSSIYFAKLRTEDQGVFRCFVKNFFGQDTSNLCTLKITQNPKPQITTQPNSLQVITGKSAVFVCEALPENVQKQWLRNGIEIPQATRDTYVILSTSLQDNDAKFKCRVSNKEGSIESNEAVLKVFDSEQKPVITKHPSNAAVSLGQKAEFSISATGTNLMFQWQKNQITIPGANFMHFQTDPVTNADNGSQIRCIISNSSGADTSTEALLTVTGTESKPTIVQHPQSVEATEGSEAQFNIVSTGANLVYQWTKNNTPIPNATTATLKFTVSLSDNNAKFKCIVTNALGSVESNEAVLTVVQKIDPPKIIKQPENTITPKGQQARFSIAASGTNLSYQWQKNSSDIAGATANSLVLLSVEKTDNNTKFKCIVKNSAATLISDEVTLSVHYVEIKTQPQSQTTEAGKSVTFTIEVETNPSPKFQWLKNGSEIASGIEKTYIKNDVKIEENNSEYTCKISLENSSITPTLSQPAILTVTDGAITITSQPQKQTVKVGESASFKIEASGTNLSYQWQKNGSSIGSNSQSVSFPAEKSDNNAVIKCIVKNSSSQKESAGATLTVQWPPRITQQPQSISVNAEQTAEFSITAENGNPATTQYQWYDQNNSTINPSVGGNTNRIRFTAKYPANNNAQFYCKITNGTTTGETSDRATLKVICDPPRITQQPTDFNGSVNGTATFRIVATGTPPLNYQWYFQGSAASNGTQSSFSKSITSDMGGKSFPVYCAVSNAAGKVESSEVQLVVAEDYYINNVKLLTDRYLEVTYNTNIPASDLEFQWKADGVNLIEGVLVKGVKTNKINWVDQENCKGKTFSCLVSGKGKSVMSDSWTFPTRLFDFSHPQ